jgi:hypothetical protein
MWVYLKTESGSYSTGLWTVGFYDPEGRWHAESDYDNREEAAARVNWLNGGTGQLSTRIEVRPYEEVDFELRGFTELLPEEERALGAERTPEGEEGGK